jgi:hypothetical protein
VPIDETIIEELRIGALTAIDGLWFMATEKKLGFDAALELDIEVWKQYGRIMLGRASKLMGIDLESAERPDLETVSDLLEVLCAIDGSACSVEVKSPDTAVLTVSRCSWWENLKKSGRQTYVPCDLVDNATFETWLKAVDPTLRMEVGQAMPKGDRCCTWMLWRQAGSK